MSSKFPNADVKLLSFSCSVSSALRVSATMTSSRRPPAAVWHHFLSASNRSIAQSSPLSIQFSNTERTDTDLSKHLGWNVIVLCWIWAPEVDVCFRVLEWLKTSTTCIKFFFHQLFVLLAKHFGLTELWNMQAVNHWLMWVIYLCSCI